MALMTVLEQVSCRTLRQVPYVADAVPHPKASLHDAYRAATAVVPGRHKVTTAGLGADAELDACDGARTRQARRRRFREKAVRAPCTSRAMSERRCDAWTRILGIPATGRCELLRP